MTRAAGDEHQPRRPRGRLPRRASALAAIACVVAASTAPAHAECVATWFSPELVTNTRTAVPEGASLVVMAVPDFRHEEYREGAFSRGFKLTRRGREVALRVEEVGAGVARLVPAGTLSPGLWRLEGLPTAASVNVSRNAELPPAPAAPQGVSMAMPRVRGRGARSENARAVVAAFEPSSPRHAILLGRWDGVIHASARVRPDDAEVALFRPARCVVPYPGVEAPATGTLRELVWLDQWGRQSPPYRVP